MISEMLKQDQEGIEENSDQESNGEYKEVGHQDLVFAYDRPDFDNHIQKKNQSILKQF